MTRARALMLQGTASDVGKSVLVAGLCRIWHRQGLRVAPFKPQNMSNNAAACADGGEIGRAQALQARACGLAPRVDFNPVLLKPESDRRAQVVVHGRALGSREAGDYFADRDTLLTPVMESFERLRSGFDLVVVEGAGSPAEINLRARDIANMGFARAADVPVVLIGDIDRGGVIASVVGTRAVIEPDDAAMIVGFLINKFRGDPRLFDDGLQAIVDRSGWPSFGVLPWQPAVAQLPAEDAVVLERPQACAGGSLVIAAPMLSRMANFDDADPLRSEPGVDFRWVPPGRPIPADADVLMLFGSKSTLAEMAFIETQGWHHDIIAHARRGGAVFGVCGGYQLLGHRIADPDGVEGAAGERPGLGLLDVDTVLQGQKCVRPVEARASTGEAVHAYEIHVGRTRGPDSARPLFSVDGEPEGATAMGGRVHGTYLHGVFANDAWRRRWLRDLGAPAAERDFEAGVDRALDALADAMAEHLDTEALLAAAR